MALKNVLMTGGTGYLGSHLLAWLLANDYNVTLLKRTTSNLCRIENLLSSVCVYDISAQPLNEVFEKTSFDFILHCATNYGRRTVPPTEIIEANLTLPLSLLQLATNYGVRAFVNTDTILDKRVNEYSLSKKHFLDWLYRYSDELTCINVSLAHFFGAFDDRSKFVTSIIMSLLDETPTLDLTPGQQRRDFVYISDVVEAFAQIILFADIAMEKTMYHFDVGTNESIDIRTMVEMIKTLTGNQKTKLCFGALPYRSNEAMDVKINTKPLEQLGWYPKVSLRDGLISTIEYEKEQLLNGSQQRSQQSSSLSSKCAF